MIQAQGILRQNEIRNLDLTAMVSSYVKWNHKLAKNPLMSIAYVQTPLTPIKWLNGKDIYVNSIFVKVI